MTNCRYLGENERIERISEFTVETRSAAFGLFVRIALNRSAELTVLSLSFPFSSYFYLHICLHKQIIKNLSNNNKQTNKTIQYKYTNE